MKPNTLFYNTISSRYDFYKEDGGLYGGLHCGECFEVLLNGVYVPTRIEMYNDWYLVGLNGLKLDGLEIKMQ